MGLADFWDNITTPGFIEHAYKDLKTIFRETGEEAAELIEEGKELFTDGFTEMVVKGNSGYKSSFDKRTMAAELISKAKVCLLEARGINEDSLDVINPLIHSLKRATEVLSRASHETMVAVESDIRSNYQQLRPVSIENIRDMCFILNSIQDLPCEPLYQAEKGNAHEAFLLAKNDAHEDAPRSGRVRMADNFLNKAIAYAETLDAEAARQLREGPLVDIGKITGAPLDLLKKCNEQLNDTALKLYYPPMGSRSAKNKTMWTLHVTVLASGICRLMAQALTDFPSDDNMESAPEFLAELGAVVSAAEKYESQTDDETVEDPPVSLFYGLATAAMKINKRTPEAGEQSGE